MKLLLFIVILIFMLIFKSGLFEGAPKLTEKPVGFNEEFTINENNQLDWHFKSSRFLDNTFIYFDKLNFSTGLNFAGYGLIGLSEEDYQEYMQIKKNSCPAPFLNSHTFLYVVLAHEPEILKTLKSCKTGQKLKVEGYYLEYSLEHKTGQQVSFSFPQKSDFVYIERIEKY